MGFRFQRRISLGSGISLNLGKKGMSVSLGPRGCRTTIGSRGIKHSYGIPGTGIRYETPYQKFGGSRASNAPLDHGFSGGRYQTVSLWQRIRDFLGF